MEDINKPWKATSVRAYAGIGNTKLWKLIKSGNFPQPKRLLSETGLPGRTRYWDPLEVIEWVEKQVFAERKPVELIPDNIRETASSGLYAAFRPLPKEGAAGNA